MKRRRKKDWVGYLKIPAVTVAAAVALGTAYRYGYVWLTLPERVEAGESERGDIKQWISRQQIIQEEQQKINDYYYRQEKEKPPIVSRDGKWFWNDSLKQWRPIRELRERR